MTCRKYLTDELVFFLWSHTGFCCRCKLCNVGAEFNDLAQECSSSSAFKSDFLWGVAEGLLALLSLQVGMCTKKTFQRVSTVGNHQDPFSCNHRWKTLVCSSKKLGVSGQNQLPKGKYMMLKKKIKKNVLLNYIFIVLFFHFRKWGDIKPPYLHVK